MSEISYSTLSEALTGAGQIVIPSSCLRVEDEDLSRARRAERLPFIAR
jgi:hypothetical protein